MLGGGTCKHLRICFLANINIGYISGVTGSQLLHIGHELLQQNMQFFQLFLVRLT